MITMISIALAISITTGLGVTVSQYLDDHIDNVTSSASIIISSLGLEKIDAHHAFLYGMIANDGTQNISLTSIEIIPPDSDTCNTNSCILSANLDNGDSICQIGTPANPCDDCQQSCVLHPGKSLSLGPSLHVIDLNVGKRYAILINANTEHNSKIANIEHVQVR